MADNDFLARIVARLDKNQAQNDLDAFLKKKHEIIVDVKIGKIIDIDSIEKQIRAAIERATGAAQSEASKAAAQAAAQAKRALTQGKYDFETGKFSATSAVMKKQLNDYNNQMSEALTKARQMKVEYDRAFQMVTDHFSGDMVLDDKQLGNAFSRMSKYAKTFQNSMREVGAEMTKTISSSEAIAKSNEIMTYMKNNTKSLKVYGNALQQLAERAKNATTKGEISKINAEFKELKTTISAQGLSGRSFLDEAVRGLKQIGQFVGTYRLLMQIPILIKNMTNEVIACDTALTELRKVSDASQAELSSVFDKATDSAKKYGIAISDVVNSVSDWKRLGYSMDEAMRLADATTLLQTVGDNMTQETASQAIISTLRGFSLDTNDVERVIDLYNEIANTEPIDTKGLSEALERSASSLAAAGNTLEQSMALITAANSVVQDPASVGTAFKTITMRIRGAKTEMESLGLDTEGMVESTAKLRNEIMALTDVDIMINDDTFKDTYTILDELAKKWKDLTDIQQAGVTELIAGKRQGNIISALMTNFDIARDTLATANTTAEGSAQKEFENYKQSIMYSIGQFKVAFQELSNTVLNSDLIKGIVDGGTTAIEILNEIIKLVGNLGTVISSVFIGKAIHTFVSQFETLRAIGRVLSTLNTKGFSRGFSDIQAALDGLAVSTKLSILSMTSLTEAEKINVLTTSTFTKEQAAAALAEQAVAAGAVSAQGGITGLGAALKGLLITNPFLVIATGIAAAIAAITMFKSAIDRANEEARSAAVDSVKEWKNVDGDIESQIARVNELYEKLDSGKLTEQQAYEAKSELLEIQQSLTESYGNLAAGIDLVNGSHDAEIEKLREIRELEAQDNYNKNRRQYEKAAKEMQKTGTRFLATVPNSGSSEQEFLKAIQNGDYKDIINVFDRGDGFSEITVTADVQQSRDAINSIITDLQHVEQKYGEIEFENDWLNEQLDELDNVIDKYGLLYQTYKEQALLTDVRTIDVGQQQMRPAELLGEYAEAIQAYNAAVATGSKKAVEDAAKNFATLDTVVKDVMNNKDFDLYDTLFGDARKGLNETAISIRQFTDILSGAIVDTTSQNIKKQADALKDLALEEWNLKDMFITDGLSAGEDEFNKLIDAAKEMGIVTGDTVDDIQPLIDILSKAGVIGVQSAEAVQKSFAEILADTSDGSISKNTDKFQSQMQALAEAKEKLSKGEPISLVDLQQVEGFETLTDLATTTMDSLGNLQLDKVSEFVRGFWSQFKDVTDPTVLRDAGSFITNVLNEVDFSNVDLDTLKSRVMQSIWSGISGGESIQNAQALQDTITNLIQTDSDWEVAYRLTLLPGFYEMTPDEVIAAYKDLKIMVSLTAEDRDIKNIQERIEQRQRETARLEAEEALRQAQGIAYSPDYYNQKTNNAYLDYLDRQGIATKKNDKLNQLTPSSTVGRDYYKQLEKEAYEAETEAINAYTAYIESRNAEIDAWTTATSNRLSSVTTALDESASATGVSADAMQSLRSAYSDLNGADTSRLFYRTAEGMKLNTEEARKLIEAEYDLQNNRFEQAIKDKQEAIENYKNSASQIDNSALKAAEEELKQLMDLSAQNYANYLQQLAAIDGHALIDYADSTANSIDRYKKDKSYLKEAKEFYDKGQVGSDDFKQRAAYFDQYGFKDADTFFKNYEKFNQFFTDDSSGLVKFADYLTTVGVMSKDALGGYVLQMHDADQAASTAGMSLALFQDLLMALNEYGGEITLVQSAEDGELQLQALNQQLTEEQKKLIELKALGADNSVIEQQEEVIQSTKDQIESVKSATEYAIESSQRQAEAEIVTLKDQWTQMAQFRKEALKRGDQESADAWEQSMRELAEKHGLTITPDLKLNETEYQELLDKTFGGDTTKMLSLKYNVSEDSVKSAEEALMSTFDGSTEKIQEATTALNEYSAAELLAIDHADGDWSAGEAELEGFAQSLGLSVDQCDALVVALEALGLLKPEVEVDTTGVETAEEEITGTEVEKEVKYNPNPEKLKEVEENVKKNSIEYKVNTVLAEGAVTPEAVKEMDGETISTIFNVEGEDQIQAVRDAVAEIDAADGYDLVVRIDEEQIAALTEANTIEDQDIGVTVDTEQWDSFVENVEGTELSTTVTVEQDGATSEGSSSETEVTVTQKPDPLQVNLKADPVTVEQEGTLTAQVDDVIAKISADTGSEDGLLHVEAAETEAPVTANTGSEDGKLHVESAETEASVKANTGFEDGMIHVGIADLVARIEADTGSEDGNLHVGVQAEGNISTTLSDMQNTANENPIIVEVKTTGGYKADESVETPEIEASETIDVDATAKVTNIDESDIQDETVVIEGEVEISEETLPNETVVIDGDNTQLNETLVQSETELDQLAAKQTTPEIEADNTDATNKISQTESDMNVLSSKVATPSVQLHGVSEAISQVESLYSKLNQLDGKVAVSTTINNTVGMPKAFGTAYATGFLNHAYQAGSDWGLQSNEDALVNEIGQESIVRDGHWFLLPGGPHIEKLKRGDIIFNAEQTEDLIETGKTARRGMLVAGNSSYADGTVNGMSAYSGMNGGIKFRNNTTSSSSGSKSKSSSSKKSSSSSKKNSSSSKNSGKALDKIKEWFDSLFDWIEVRVDRLERNIDLAQARADNAVGYAAKNTQLTNAMNTIGKANGTSGLIKDSIDGAARYLKQAEAVRKKAVSVGLVTQDNSKNIVELIKKGTININEYDEETRTFIEEYTEWYEKSLDLTAQVEELRSQLKELEQAKLDNITDQFDSMSSYIDSISDRAEAMIGFFTSAGRSVNSSDFKSQLNIQIQDQTKLIGILNNELKTYVNELVNAKDVFGASSNEYRDALAGYEKINKALIEATTQYNELNKELYELDLTKIQYAIDRIEQFGKKLSDIVSLKNLRGTIFGSQDVVREFDYAQQIANNNDFIKYTYSDRQKRINEIVKNGWDVDSENYKQAYDAIVQDEEAIFKMLSANEELKQSIRSLRWKPFEDLQKELGNVIQDYDHLMSLITEPEMFDDGDGTTITGRGYASIALLAEQIATAKQQIADYRKALDKLEQEYRNGNISLETYNDTSREYIGIIQQGVASIEGYKDALVSMYRTQITNENNALQEVIDKRREALSAKKAYYDYDKTLDKKNKDITQLRAQVAALSGVTNDAAKAQRAKLQAQLAEAEEDLKDTIRQHQYEATEAGYEKLSEDSQEALDNTLQRLEANAEMQDQVVNLMLGKIKDNYTEAYSAINDIISSTGTVIGDVTSSSINQLETSADRLISLAEAMSEFQTQASAVANQINTNAVNMQYGSASQSGTVSNIESTLRSANASTVIAQAKASTPSKATSTPNIKSAETAANEAAAAKAAADAAAAKKAAAEEAAKKAKAAQQEAQARDAIMAAINLGKKRTSVSKAEQKKHLPIWNYITLKYGHELQYKVYSALAKAMNKFWGTNFNTDGTKLKNADKSKMLDLLKAHGFKRGTKRVSQDELAWTNENWERSGAEMIVRKQDGAIFTPLKSGDSVIPANLSSNLFKWGAINPSTVIKANGGLITPTNTNNSNITVQYGSLLTVNGDVDREVLPDLQVILEKAYKYTSKELYKEAKKVGYRK